MDAVKPTWRHWGALALAIVLEVLGTTVMKVSHGWSFSHAAALGLGAMWLCVALSYYCLSRATTALPVGVAFACWEAAGLALITLSSVLVVGEALTLPRFLGLCCVLGGALLVHAGTASGGDAPRKNAARTPAAESTTAIETMVGAAAHHQNSCTASLTGGCAMSPSEITAQKEKPHA